MAIALAGVPAASGLAIGRVRIVQRGHANIPEYLLLADAIDDEINRLQQAMIATRQQLHEIRAQIPASVPGDIAALIDTHILILDDPTLGDAPQRLIREQRINAEWALMRQQEAVFKVFDAMEDPYLRTRRDDFGHIVHKVLRNLLCQESHPALQAGEARGSIIVASDLAPSDLALLARQQIAAIVTERGGLHAHTSIMARNLGIPAIVGLPLAEMVLRDQEMVVVDGQNGILLADLESDHLAWYQQNLAERQQAQRRLQQQRRKPAISRDGVRVQLHANIELPTELESARSSGADGIGLFRTEFLHMNGATPPDEEEQYQIYRDAIATMRGRPITFRTLDIGADKQINDHGNCRNPALGLRGIRLCLKSPELFIPQIRALLRASEHGPMNILIPMITSIEEVRQVRRLLLEHRMLLAAEGVKVARRIAVGGMIEVPSAALCADTFARELDFLSIGTNDLIQYTLATDRLDEGIAHLFDPLHPAILRLLNAILEAGRRASTPVTLCGEMAGDPILTRLLLGLGLTSFSMPPASLLNIKQIIRESEVVPLSYQVSSLLDCGDSECIRHHLRLINSEGGTRTLLPTPS
jgi:phosphoenolpyruvate-protein phosphotransferase (PTS system enzyme I)